MCENSVKVVQGHWCSFLCSASSWGSKEGKTQEILFEFFSDFLHFLHTISAQLEMDGATAFLHCSYCAVLRSVVTATSVNKTTQKKRCIVLWFFTLRQGSKQKIHFALVICLCTDYSSPWVKFIVSASERLPKWYSSVFKWGNLDSPAYPLLLASWLAHSHLLSKSIHPLSWLSKLPFPLHFCQALLPFCQYLRFRRPVLISSFSSAFLLSEVAWPCAVESCPVWLSWGIMRWVVLPQLPSHSEILASSFFHKLSLSLPGTDCLRATSKYRSGPKGHMLCFDLLCFVSPSPKSFAHPELP